MHNLVLTSLILLKRAKQLSFRDSHVLWGLNDLCAKIRVDLLEKNNRLDANFLYLHGNGFAKIAHILSNKNILQFSICLTDHTVFPDNNDRRKIVLSSLRLAVRMLALNGLPHKPYRKKISAHGLLSRISLLPPELNRPATIMISIGKK